MSDIDFPRFFIVLVVLLFSLTVHEAAHAWSADRLGDSTARSLGRLSLNPLVHIDPVGSLLLPLLAFVANLPLLGWAKPVPVDVRRLRHGRRDHVLVAAAGPASNLALGAVAALAVTLLRVSPVVRGELNLSAPAASFFSSAVQINVLLAVLNMIPIPPLDGGNVIGGLLPSGAARRFDAIARPYGVVLLYFLMFPEALAEAIFRTSACGPQSTCAGIVTAVRDTLVVARGWLLWPARALTSLLA